VRFLIFILATLALPASASEPKEMPAFWYDLIAAEDLAELVAAECAEFETDSLVAYRLRNRATGDLADYGIHTRTATVPMSLGGMLLASVRVASGIPLGENLCEFGQDHLQQKTALGARLKRVGE